MHLGNNNNSSPSATIGSGSSCSSYWRRIMKKTLSLKNPRKTKHVSLVLVFVMICIMEMKLWSKQTHLNLVNVVPPLDIDHPQQIGRKEEGLEPHRHPHHHQQQQQQQQQQNRSSTSNTTTAITDPNDASMNTSLVNIDHDSDVGGKENGTNDVADVWIGGGSNNSTNNGMTWFLTDQEQLLVESFNEDQMKNIQKTILAVFRRYQFSEKLIRNLKLVLKRSCNIDVWKGLLNLSNFTNRDKYNINEQHNGISCATCPKGRKVRRYLKDMVGGVCNTTCTIDQVDILRNRFFII